MQMDLLKRLIYWEDSYHSYESKNEKYKIDWMIQSNIWLEIVNGNDLVHLKSNLCIKWNQVMCSRWLCSRLKTSLIWWHPQLIKNWKKGFGLMEASQVVSICFFFWSWVDRKAVLLRGMHHDHGLILSSAQVNPCEVLERLIWELNSMYTGCAYRTCPVWVLLCILTFWVVVTRELFWRASALSVRVSSADTSEVPTYVGSSDVGFSMVGNSKLLGVCLLASTISDVSGMIPDASGMANG